METISKAYRNMHNDLLKVQQFNNKVDFGIKISQYK